MTDPNIVQSLMKEIETTFLQCSEENQSRTELDNRLQDIKRQWKTICEPSEIGRPEFLMAQYMYVNDLVENELFLRYSQDAYEVCVGIHQWHSTCLVCEQVLETFLKMGPLNEHGKLEALNWFAQWAKSAEIWIEEIKPNEELWNQMGTAYLSRCEWFFDIDSLDEKVLDFWRNLINSYGSFTPTEEYQRNFADFLEQTIAELGRNADYRIIAKRNFIKKRIFFRGIDVPPELIDMINRQIAVLPSMISEDEIEVQINQLNDEKDFSEACSIVESFATRLRISGQRDIAISLMKKVLDRTDSEKESYISNRVRIKLGIYLDEEGSDIDEILPLFQNVLELPLNDDLERLENQYNSASRISSLFAEQGEIQRGLEYSQKALQLAELRGDDYDLVKSAWNYASDLYHTNQESYLQFYELGIIHLYDALTKGEFQANANQTASLMNLFQGLSMKLGQQQRYDMVIEEIRKNLQKDFPKHEP